METQTKPPRSKGIYTSKVDRLELERLRLRKMLFKLTNDAGVEEIMLQVNKVFGIALSVDKDQDFDVSGRFCKAGSIMKDSLKYFGIQYEVYCSKDREISDERALIHYALNHVGRLSYNYIGAKSDRHHTAVRYSCLTYVPDYTTTDRVFREKAARYFCFLKSKNHPVLEEYLRADANGVIYFMGLPTKMVKQGNWGWIPI